MSLAIGEYVRAAFAPPRYVSLPFSGIDISTSGVKAVRVAVGRHGPVLAEYAALPITQDAYANGEVVDCAAVAKDVAAVARATHIMATNVALPESKSYLFEATVSGETKSQWRVSVEQRLDELVPLPPPLTAFDIVKIGQKSASEVVVEGIGFAQRIVDDTLAVFDNAGITVRALEGEKFATARALLPAGDETTVLIIDVGKTTTKIYITTCRIPRFATTIGIGGHALTLAVQKYFDVTEAEAKRVKVEKGIVPTQGNEEYLSAMLSTVSAIRDEIATRLNYWQAKVVAGGGHEPVSHAILVGGNSSVRGLPEYLESTLRIPVVMGDVFTNFAPRDTWLPPIDYTESLAYATAIGLALYDVETL